MHTVTLKEADRDLKAIIRRTIRDKDEIVIASDEGAVVMMDEAEWLRIKETLCLLSDRASLAALLESHVARDQGRCPDGIAAEDAFKDV